MKLMKAPRIHPIIVPREIQQHRSHHRKVINDAIQSLAEICIKDTAAIPVITCSIYICFRLMVQMVSIRKAKIVTPKLMHELEELSVDKISIDQGVQGPSV